MTDTSTPPDPQPVPELPEEKKGDKRMWLYFGIGAALLLLIIYLASRK